MKTQKMTQTINFVPNGFCHITMAGENFKAQSRAKDAMIVPLPETTAETTPTCCASMTAAAVQSGR